MQLRQSASLVLGAGLALAASTTLARADKIDGNWCRADGSRLSIDGPNILTPGGAPITGDYHRHAFSYVPPPPEPGAGTEVDMRLVDENTVHLYPGPGQTMQVWLRCGPPVSLLWPPPPGPG